MAKGGVSPDIRFSDVAHYVGLSLMKDPSSNPKSGPLAKSSIRLHPLKSHEAHQRSVASASSTRSFSREDNQKADKLKTQIEWLRAEHKAEQEQLRRLESCLSDSMLLEKRAQKKSSTPSRSATLPPEASFRGGAKNSGSSARIEGQPKDKGYA